MGVMSAGLLRGPPFPEREGVYMKNIPRARTLFGVLVSVVALVAIATVPAAAVSPPHTSIVSEAPASCTPNIQNGRVNALLVMGNHVYVGGTFTTVRNAGSSANITRNYLFSFNQTTGVVDTSFAPKLNRAVEAIAP